MVIRMSQEVRERLSAVRLLAMDVDGVLTDGALIYDSRGRECKRFHVSDGLGMVVLRQSAVLVAWISGRRHAGVEQRAKELQVGELRQGVRDKQAVLTEIGANANIPLSEIAYIGDDWNDIPALEIVGCPIAVANAAAVVKEHAVFITSASGGNGAVREVCEAIL